MHEKDRQEINLIELGEMFGKVNSMDEKMDTFIEETGEFRKDLKVTLKDHNKRINWNKNKLMWLIGLLVGSGILTGTIKLY